MSAQEGQVLASNLARFVPCAGCTRLFDAVPTRTHPSHLGAIAALFLRFLERVLIESKCLPLDTLGIIPGKVVWMLCVDVVVCAMHAAIECVH